MKEYNYFGLEYCSFCPISHYLDLGVAGLLLMLYSHAPADLSGGDKKFSIVRHLVKLLMLWSNHSVGHFQLIISLMVST